VSYNWSNSLVAFVLACWKRSTTDERNDLLEEGGIASIVLIWLAGVVGGSTSRARCEWSADRDILSQSALQGTNRRDKNLFPEKMKLIQITCICQHWYKKLGDTSACEKVSLMNGR
jgi:hypothetical protein